jgi:hypothetical protein
VLRHGYSEMTRYIIENIRELGWTLDQPDLSGNIPLLRSSYSNHGCFPLLGPPSFPTRANVSSTVSRGSEELAFVISSFARYTTGPTLCKSIYCGAMVLTWYAKRLCRQKRVAVLLVRPRNIQHPHMSVFNHVCMALNDLTKPTSHIFCTFHSISRPIF